MTMINRSGLRTEPLDIKPRTILTVDSYTRFCICVHSLYSSHEPFFDPSFLIAHYNAFLDTRLKSFLQISRSKTKIFMFAQILFMNFLENKHCLRSSSLRHETKLHGVDVNLSSYDGFKFICSIIFIT